MLTNHDKIGFAMQSGVIAYAALTVQELVLIGGFLIALSQFLMNAYFKRQENRRREEEHEQKMSENKR